jgi:phenylacetate-CoA ligase
LGIHDANLERADRATIRGLQFDKLRRLLEKAWSTNAFYRDRWRAAGVVLEEIGSLDAFSARVPVVEKADFMRDQEDEPPFGRRHAHVLESGAPYYVGLTGGTTGQGVEVHLQTADEMMGTAEVYAYYFAWAGVGRGDLVFLTMPVTMMGGGRIEYDGARANGLSVCAVGNYDAARKLELMRRFRPKALLGTTSYFGHLAAVSAESPPSPGLAKLLTGAEGAGIAYLRRLEELWQAPIYDRYGSTQVGNDHMFSCEAGLGDPDRPAMLHNIDPMVLCEVIDPETGRHVEDGEAGEVVLTSLYHTATPLIRWRSRDRAVYRDPRTCACGRPFAGVEVASLNRADDVVKVKGVNIWPQAVEDTLFTEDLVDEFEVILASSDTEADLATARIMPVRPLTETESARLREALVGKLRRKAGISFEIELIAPGGLVRSEHKIRRWKDRRVHRSGAGTP